MGQAVGTRRPRGRALVVVVVLVGACLATAAVAWALTGEDDREVGAPDRDQAVRDLLRPWYDALARQEDEPARVVVVGDSISEGAGMPSPVHENRFVGMLHQRLREAVGAPPAAGFLPAYYADALTVDDTERGGASPQEYPFEKWGLGGRALFMPHTSTLTYPAQEARRVRVWFGAIDFLGGQATVEVDGVDITAQGTLRDGGDAGERLSSSADEPRAGLWWESPELEPGEHVVSVRSVQPGGVFVHTGVEFLDPDADSGVHVYDGSHSGATAQHFTTEEMAAGHWAEVAALDPQLVLVNLGTNPDLDYRGNLERVVDLALEAAPRARVLLVDGYEPGNWSSADWAQVRRARREVAALHPDRVAVFDLAAHWPELAKDGSTSEGLMMEPVVPLHPNRDGNEHMAEVFADLLLPED